MKHYQTKPVFTAPPPPPTVSKRRLLEDRKAALELEIRDRLRSARTSVFPANVKSLSAALRKVKADLAAIKPKITGATDAR